MIIAMCCTRSWYEYLFVVLYSLFKNNDVKKIYLFIEDNEINILKDSRIEFINVNNIQEYVSKKSPNYNTRYTQMTYIRCYLSKLLKEDKILYLDTDTIIDGNISSLWNIDLTDYAVAGVKEPR